jgi:phasin
MQAFAEQSFKQARQAFDTFVSATQRAVATFEDQAAAAQAGAKDIQHKAVTFTERNIAASFDFTQRLLQAKSPEEVIQLHAEHVRSQMEALGEQARELAGVAIAAAKPRT